MLKNVFRVDEFGFIVDAHTVKIKDGSAIGYIDATGQFSDDTPSGLVIEDLPQPCHYIRPRWNGTGWVEGETEEERFLREEEDKLQSLLPTLKDIDDAELEIKILTILLEMGMLE